MRYAKYKKQYRFKDLRDDKEFREKYSNSLIYSRSYPYIIYFWFADKCSVVLFKRPLVIRTCDTVVSSVVIKTDTAKAARIIARNLTEKELQRMFNKCNYIIL